MFDSIPKKIDKMHKCYKEGNYKQAIEIYEQLLKDNYGASSSFHSDVYIELGECYYKADPPYNNVNKAVELFNKAINLGCTYAKSRLAFCYIFGDGVPASLQKALDLFKEAGKNDMDKLADFVLDHLIDIRVLFELLKQGKTDDIVYAISDPMRRRDFTAIIGMWAGTAHFRKGVHNRIEEAEDMLKTLNDWNQELGYLTNSNRCYYDSTRLKTLADIWENVFGSISVDKYHHPAFLEWFRYFHHTKGETKRAIIGTIDKAAWNNNHDEALKLYNATLICLAEMSRKGYIMP